MGVTRRIELDLPAEVAARIDAEVGAGAYASPGEVVAAALEGWPGPDEPAASEALRARIAAALADPRTHPGREVFDEVRRRHAARFGGEHGG